MESCLFSYLTGLQPVLFASFFEQENLLVICSYFSAKRRVLPIGTHTHSCRELFFSLKIHRGSYMSAHVLLNFI